MEKNNAIEFFAFSVLCIYTSAFIAVICFVINYIKKELNDESNRKKEDLGEI